MSIRILESKCCGCGNCADICPGGLFEMKNGKSFLPHPEDCWACASCIKECPEAALRMYLGSDIGGLGGAIHARREGSELKWIIELPGKELRILTTDSRSANEY
ncbi:MAG: ferredoxin family protein [Clostridiales bacterium]|nr:ferredoxin family protein [Clostridiales bacterium]